MSGSDRSVLSDVPRRASPGDAAEFARLERLCFAPFWSAEEIARALAEPATEAWILRGPDARLEGFAIGSVVGDEAELHRVATAPERRRRGVGRLLLAAFLAACHARDATACWLEVRADNEAARALYESLGFRPVTTRRNYYADGADAVVYRLQLASGSR